MKISYSISILSLLSAVSFNISANGADGVIAIKSRYSVTQTIDKLETTLKNKGMTIFKRIAHSEGAKRADLNLRPTELLIFGNPKIGTLLMQCKQTTALDLPMKALSYKDKNGQVWLVYNDPYYIAERHHVNGCEKVLKKMSNALSNFSKAATQ